METVRGIWSVVALACLAISPSLAGESDGGKGVSAVRKILDDQAAAWNKRDLEGFMTGYWKSEQLTFVSGNTVTKGWQATLDRYRKRYQADGKEMGKLAFTEVRVQMLGSEHALVTGRFRLTLAKEEPTGLFTLIVRRLPAGWRIVHDHTSV